MASTVTTTATRALKIASVCTLLPTPASPSAGVFVQHRLNGMATQAEVHVIQPVPYFPSLRPLPAWLGQAEAVPSNRQPVPMFYVPGVLKSLDDRWLARAIEAPIRQLATKDGVELIDAQFGYPAGAGVRRVADRLKLPYFVTVRGFEEVFLRRRVIGDKLRRAFLDAAGCICVSHSLGQVLRDVGVPEERLAVIHNATDRERFHVRDRAQARRALALPEHAPVLVSVAHLIRGKGFHVLLEAFARLPAKHDARLVLIGGAHVDPGYAEELKRQVSALKLHDRVVFQGEVAPDHMPTWLAAADLFVLCTQREGCCNAVLEALACGLPVITTPAGDNPYFVKPGANGDLVPIDDAAATSEAIARALERSWDRQAIAEGLPVADGWASVGRDVTEFMRSRL